MGGMTQAVQSGWAKLKIEASAAEKQARIDSGQDVIVGVNKYKLAEEDAIDTLAIDNHAVRENQVEAPEGDPRRARRRRGEGRARRADRGRAERRRQPARAVDRRGARCAPRSARSATRSKRPGAGIAPTRRRSPASTPPPTTAPKAGSSSSTRSPPSPRKQGRRPRVMIAKLGQDGHDRGAKVVASAFADLGFDVDIGPLFQTAEECARQAIENDVHAVGVSHAGGRPQDAGAGDHRGAEGAGRATTSSSSSAA